jgi:uncharacterized protein
MRLLLWLVLFVAIVFALKKKVQTGFTAGGGADASPHASGASATQDAEAMVCCVHCQLHVPVSEAVYRGRQAYCCEAHAQQSGTH